MAFPSGWGWSAKLPVKAGQMPSSRTNPVLVVITAALSTNASAIYSQARSDGGDIRASTDEAGAVQIPCYVKSFNAGGESCEIYVKPATFAAGDSVYLWWGKADEVAPVATTTYGQYAAVHGQTAQSVKARWTLNEDPTGGAPQMTDLTENAHHGTVGNTPDSVAGKVGNGLYLDDASNEYVDFTQHADFEPTGNFTISLWWKNNAADGTDQRIFNTAGTGATGWELRRLTANTLRFGGKAPDWLNLNTSASGTFTGTDWVHVAIVIGSTGQIYINGVASGTPDSSFGSLVYAGNICAIGVPNGGALTATIDNVVFRHSVDAGDDILVEYRNTNDNAAFWEAEAPVAAGGMLNRFGSMLGGISSGMSGMPMSGGMRG